MSALCVTHIIPYHSHSLSLFYPLIVAMLAFFSFLEDFKLACILGTLYLLFLCLKYLDPRPLHDCLPLVI